MHIIHRAISCITLQIPKIFEDFEAEPMAAASIAQASSGRAAASSRLFRAIPAQVHAARLRSGERCVWSPGNSHGGQFYHPKCYEMLR